MVHPCSKLATTRWWQDTTIACDFSVGDAYTDDLYGALDWLAERRGFTEAHLARTSPHRGFSGTIRSLVPCRKGQNAHSPNSDTGESISQVRLKSNMALWWARSFRPSAIYVEVRSAFDECLRFAIIYLLQKSHLVNLWLTLPLGSSSV